MNVVNEGEVGGTRHYVAFLSLTNLMPHEQTATVIIDVEGGQQFRVVRTIPGCKSGGGDRVGLSLGVHTIPGFPASGFFRVQVGWPGPGSAGLTMRSLDNWNDAVTPPIVVIR